MTYERIELLKNQLFDNKRKASLAGAHPITVNPDILDKILERPIRDWSVNQFIKDWGKCIWNRKVNY